MAHSTSIGLPLLLGGTIGLIVLRFLLIAVYRIFFHQLKSYPGPRIAAATGLYCMYKCLVGKEVEWVRQMHEQYGDVVRLGPSRLSYINPGAWKEVYNYKSGPRLENRKDPNFYVTEVNGASSIVNSATTEEHSRLRRIFSPAFSDRALQLQEPLIRQYTEQLISNIRRDSTDPGVYLDAVKLYNCTTFDIMGDLTFGEPLGLLQKSDYTPWVRTVFTSVKASVFLRFANEYPALDYLVKLFAGKTLLSKRLEHFDHSALRVDKRLAKGEIEKPDIWKFVLERGKEVLSLDQMHANACVFMLAGTETTATLLSGLSYLLLKHPAKMQKVVAEVRALPREDLSLEKLKQLPYLNACLEEGLRMYPPIPIGLPRVVPSTGAKIDGKWVCGNTVITVPHCVAYYSELNFTRPNSFEPERWLPGSVGYEKDRKEVLQPFSFGPRNCIGKSLAYHEMRMILASVLWHFDLELCSESEGWMDQKIFTLYEKPELLVKYIPVRS